jgi:hypothetical protein
MEPKQDVPFDKMDTYEFFNVVNVLESKIQQMEIQRSKDSDALYNHVCILRDRYKCTEDRYYYLEKSFNSKFKGLESKCDKLIVSLVKKVNTKDTYIIKNKFEFISTIDNLKHQIKILHYICYTQLFFVFVIFLLK